MSKQTCATCKKKRGFYRIVFEEHWFVACDTVCLLDTKMLEKHAACLYSLHFTADIRPYCLTTMLQSADAVELALKLDGEELKKRKLRVQRCVKKPTKKHGSNQEHKAVKKRNQKFKESTMKTQNKEEMNIMKEPEDKEDIFNLSSSDTERKQSKPSQKFSAFQGQKVAEDKKLGKVMSHRIRFVHVIYTLSVTKTLWLKVEVHKILEYNFSV